jgi:hypothetical protein
MHGMQRARAVRERWRLRRPGSDGCGGIWLKRGRKMSIFAGKIDSPECVIKKMKVVVKNIAQKVFEIELDASSSVRDVKNRLNEQHAIGSPELLKLIFQGKVLADEEILNGTVNYSDDKFMVVMVTKPKAPAAVASAASPAASEAKAPAASVPAANAAQPAPSAPAPASAPVAAPPPAAPQAAPAVSSAVQLQIDQICEMGFERAQVELCMRAAFNNGDRAVEYLMSGIPASVQASMSQSLPLRAAPAPAQPRGDCPASPLSICNFAAAIALSTFPPNLLAHILSQRLVPLSHLSIWPLLNPSPILSVTLATTKTTATSTEWARNQAQATFVKFSPKTLKCLPKFCKKWVKPIPN